MKKLGKVVPYMLGDHLIIGLDKNWINITKTIPEFSIVIDNNNRFCLIGPKLGVDNNDM